MSEAPAPSAARGWSAVFPGCALGAALQVMQAQLWALALYQGVMLAGLAALAGWRWRAGRKTAAQATGLHPWWPWTLFAISAALVFGGSGWRAHAFAARALERTLEGRNLRVVGTVASMVQSLPGGGQRWRFAVQEARLASNDGQALTLPPVLELSWYTAPRAAAPPPMHPGQVWEMTVRLKRPHGARNPHGFDYELWQWQRGVQATGYVRAAPGAVLRSQSGAHALEGLRQKLRDGITGRAAQGNDVQARRLAGVVAALAVGDQQAIARADWALFRDTGVAHLMSISGLHITLFAWLAAHLSGRAWRLSSRACAWCPAPRVALPGGVLLATGYALLSGWGIPAQRTVCMLAVVALLRWLGLRWPWPVVWSAALALVLTVDPWAWWQAGFWLSFVAVGVLLAGSLRGGAEPDMALASRPWWHKWRQQGLQLAREQWRISLALAPLGLLLFGQISLNGLLANLLAIPWVTLLVTPLSLASAVHPPLTDVAALALLPLMAFLRWLHGWDWALLHLPRPPLWAGVAAMAGILVLLGPFPRAWRLWGGLLCLPALYWPPVPVPEGEFTLLAPDIGQGNAVLLRTARHSLLYDSGPRHGSGPDADAQEDANAGTRVLLPLLRALGVRPDALWISHSDNDHSGGALPLRRAWPHMLLWGSDSVLRDPRLQTLGPVQRCQAGQRWTWDGVRFSVLHPPASAAPAPRQQALRQANQNSCVLLIQSASGRSALLAGDIFAAQERALVQSGALPPLDWLLVPHHGSRTSSSRAFLQATRPRWALVQAGYRNRYGHPAPDVLARHAQVHSRVVQQAHCGASHWTSQRPQELRCERQSQRRYWDIHVRTP